LLFVTCVWNDVRNFVTTQQHSRKTVTAVVVVVKLSE